MNFPIMRIIAFCWIIIGLSGRFSTAQERCHTNLKAEWKRNTFSSPGYPIPYGNDLNCTWLITTEHESQIELTFFIVDLETEYDTLKIYDGKDEDAPLLSVLHGRVHVPEATISSSGRLFLRFNSDDSIAKRGFRAQYRTALPYKTNVTSVIQSCLADTTIFREVTNQDTVQRQVDFKIIFPHEAYVTNFEMSIGGVQYFGEVEKKERVKEIYKDAAVQLVSMGYVSSTRDLAKRFFTGVFLEPKQTVKFKLVYQQLLQRRLGRYTNTIVLTRDFLLSDLSVDIYICARSNLTFLQMPPMDDAGSMSYSGQVRFLGRKDNYPDYVRVERERNMAHISYRSTRNGKKDPIKSKRNIFVTHYDVDREDHGALSVFAGEYFATFFSPYSPKLVRRIVFVLDVSGSMAGNKIKQVQIAMKNILKRLTRRDSFNIVQFESVVRKWRPEGLISATPEAKLSAQKYINSFDPEGKTNINEALITGIGLLNQITILSYLSTLVMESTYGSRVLRSGQNTRRRRPDVNPYREYMFFLGDGKPTVGVRNPVSILRAVKSANTRGYGINAIGFGKNVDVSFLQMLTRDNHGKWRIIYEDDDSHLQIQNFITELGAPIMTDISFNYSPDQVNYTTQRENLVLVDGGEVGVFGRLLPNVTDKNVTVTVTGRTFKRVSNTFSFPLDNNKTLCSRIEDKLVDEFVGRGYGIAKLEETMRRLRQTTDKDKQRDKLTDEAIDISLEFNLVTPVTSLVVKKKNDTKQEKETNKGFDNEKSNGKEPIEKPELGELVDPLPGSTKPWIFEGDPHFIVALGNNITVCFTWNGTDGQVYNLLHDPAIGVTVNGLIKYGPKSSNRSNKNDCDPNEKVTTNSSCEEQIESFFIKLGFVFSNEKIKIEVTPKEVVITDERSFKHPLTKVFSASDESSKITAGKIGINIYNITKVHSFVNITLNGTITFIINLKRGRNLPEEKKRPSLIDHMDMNVVGHSNLSPSSSGLFGVFPKDARRDFKRKMKSIYPMAKIRSHGKENILQYRKNKISVKKISIDDPYSKSPRQCWFTYEENALTGQADATFKVDNIFDAPEIYEKYYTTKYDKN